MLTNILAVTAASWGVVMAVSPVLQIRTMLRTGSARDVSMGYFGVLLPGFVLWCSYGAARGDAALVVPNATAFLVTTTTLVVARRLRRAEREAVAAPVGL